MSKLTEKQMNYFKFAKIVQTEFPKALRQVFRTMWDTTYGQKHGPWDDSANIRSFFITQEVGGKIRVPINISYEEWDTTFLIYATLCSNSFALLDGDGHQRTLLDLYVRPRNLPDGEYHSNLVSPTGNKIETIALAIDQLRLLRNRFAHWNTSEIERPMFDEYLLYVKDAFQSLGVSTSALDFTGNSLEFYAAGLLDLTNSDENTSAWEIGEIIGRGAFGEVHKCCHCLTGLVIAVKMVKIDPAHEEDLKQLQNEINILRNLRHERILPCYGGEQKDDHVYLFMDFMIMGSLSDFMKKSDKVLEENLSRKYTRQILEGVFFLHSKQIIHRDIKGPNVLLDGDGNAKLADFGLARLIQKVSSKTNVETFCGTPYWMAPERLTGKIYGRKADIWSVGCTVVEMLTGKPPLRDLEPLQVIFKIGSDPTEPKLPEGVSQDALEFLQATMSRDPDKRPWSDELLTYNFVSNTTTTTGVQEDLE